MPCMYKKSHLIASRVSSRENESVGFTYAKRWMGLRRTREGGILYFVESARGEVKRDGE